MSVDALYDPISLARSHISLTEMFTQDLTEKASQFYKFLNDYEPTKVNERIRLQKNSEETLLQIASAAETKSSTIKSNILQKFLAFISMLTIFSVIQDISSFILVEQKELIIETFRLSLLIIVFSVQFYFKRSHFNVNWRF